MIFQGPGQTFEIRWRYYEEPVLHYLASEFSTVLFVTVC